MDSSDDEEYNPQIEEVAEEEEEGEQPSASDLDRIREKGEELAKLLINTHSLGLVTKKSEIIGLINRRRDFYEPVKARAEHLIRNVYGYTLKEVAVDKDVFVFVVDEQGIENNGKHLDTTQRLEKILLFVILGYITLKGPPVPEGDILEFFRTLGIAWGNSSFGNVSEYLTVKFPAQLYLQRTKEMDPRGTGEVTFRYDWGPRSTAEVDKDELLNQYSSLLGKPVRSFVQLDSNGNVRT